MTKHLKTQIKNLEIIIPVFNEEVRLKENIDKFLNFISYNKYYSLIFVNDGSTDNTLKFLTKISKINKCVNIISYNKNMGKGYAVRKGVLASKGDLILISDVDLSTPLSELDKLTNLTTNFDIIIGSRGLINSKIEKKQSKIKIFFGKCGNFLIKKNLGLNFEDTQCGFKLFKSNIKRVFEVSRINGFGFDFEILFLANKFGFKICEVPVSWTNDERSKVKFHHYFSTLFELFKIKIVYILSGYKIKK